jgi:dipeptidase
MCDTLVALPGVTRDKTVIFAKSADCEVNEANAVVHIPGRKHVKGEAVRITHLVIPQAEETYEVLLTKAWWTYGCEIGINEFGLTMGEEAVYTTEMAEPTDGIIGPDLIRLALERSRTCREAIDLMTGLLEKYGQGGSAEMKGNSHFDSSFLMADQSEAYILETAGRKWAVKQVKELDSISNMLGISTEWQRSSEPAKTDWRGTYALPGYPTDLGATSRQSITCGTLAAEKGKITSKTIFKLMRQHGNGYHPATAETHFGVCVHAGPQKDRWWQADGVMVTEAGARGILIWLTGTSGNCVSIFKPVFLGMDLPDIGRLPTERFDPRSLWWKHELLHRRAMADFDHLVPEIRKDFDALEADFLAESESVRQGTPEEKRDFMEHCFRRSMESTERWIARLRTRSDLKLRQPAYRAMWQRLNAEAGMTGMPDENV